MIQNDQNGFRMNQMNKMNESFFFAESSGKAQVGWGKEEVTQDELQTSMLDRCQMMNRSGLSRFVVEEALSCRVQCVNRSRNGGM